MPSREVIASTAPGPLPVMQPPASCTADPSDPIRASKPCAATPFDKPLQKSRSISTEVIADDDSTSGRESQCGSARGSARSCPRVTSRGWAARLPADSPSHPSTGHEVK
ncbi:hypothetical protein B277_12321 [Janibacter hoylei PVAS-1]|uniref:Uncharacterized protein n=1 Tax=Janibacter hoylei PVAS-1 TaxID=1210046 RepID=K1DVG4_9MICO|nr:hypothetical protein [Janibacter hoylei]EKA60520.1 hypothetical protein B277_12321 [Janibacter hoylei PVAS-1]